MKRRTTNKTQNADRARVTDRSKIVAAFLLLLIVAFLADMSQEKAIKNGAVEREDVGGEEREISLVVDMEGILEGQAYTLEVLPAQPTKEEAEGYFEKAIENIEQDFKKVGEQIPLQTSYEEGVVGADWFFEPYGVIDSEGNIRYEKVEEGGTTINAQVELSCGGYEKTYRFAFLIFPKELSQEEKTLQLLDAWMEQQMSLEGSTKIQLPTEINGQEVIWSEERESITPQILLLELVAMVLFWLVSKRKRIQEEQKRMNQMEREYPEIVNQLSLLLGAGMTTRQAWNKLATQYMFKRKAGMIEEREVYEAIVRMSRRFSEGESERAIYQQFSQEIPALCFHKLVRILLGNLEKGTNGICCRLEEESRIAYEQRIQYAKKLGEEASTKMLFPLMVMLIIVMGIVMLPALIEFQI